MEAFHQASPSPPARKTNTVSKRRGQVRGRDPGQMDLSEFREKKEKEDIHVRSEGYRSMRTSCLRARDRHWERMEEQALEWNERNLPPKS